MQHQLGRISLIAWQGRRLRDTQRPRTLALALLGAMIFSALLLLVRFGAGVDIPIGVLQGAFALLVASAALLLMRVAASMILRFQHD